MKTSKTVMESIAVAALAMALSITAVTGNGVSTVNNRTVAETQGEETIVAGVAAAMSEYEKETAGQRNVVSVEKTDVELVTATAEDEVTIETEASADTENTATEETSAEAEMSAEEQEWQDKLMAKVDDFLYVRAKADGDSEIVGKLYKGDRALIKKEGSTWTKIASGNVVGYVRNDYCVTGSKALKYAKKHCKTIATVTIDGLRIREKQSTDSAIIKAVSSGETLVVNTKAKTKDGWVAVKEDGDTYYVSADYVTLSLKTGKAVTIEEEEAAEKAAAEKEAAEKAAEQQSSSGQTTTTSSTQGAGLSATADEETLLAAIIDCEVGGLSMDCMTAVGAVVINRVHSSTYANTIKDVLYQKGQFSPAGNGGLERRLAKGVSSGARKAAQAALSGSDPTGGAMYFALASSGHSGVVIGPVVFY